MRNTALLALLLIGIGSTATLEVAQARKISSSAQASSLRTSSTSKHQQDDAAKQADNGRGAELFETHCARCHKPPDDLSPRVAPAVLSHMRTRAMMSREDEEELLKFLAPGFESRAK